MNNIEIIPFFSENINSNTYLIYNTETRNAAIIDPGNDMRVFPEKYNDAKIEYILLTHGHFDHMFALSDIKEKYNAKLCIHTDDREYLTDGELNCSSVFMGRDYSYPSPDMLLYDSQTLDIIGTQIKVLHTPGHTPGSVCYIVGNAIFSGDTLFRGSVGRCDFKGGSVKLLMASLNKLKALEGDYEIYPGHGQKTGLDAAKKTNFYLKG